MGILGKLFGRDSESGGSTATTTGETVECPHLTLLGRWDSVDDMGKEDKAIMWVCDSCQSEFSPDEGARLRSAAGDRIRSDLA